MTPEQTEGRSSKWKNVGHITLAGFGLAAVLTSSRCLDDGVRERTSSEDFHQASATIDSSTNLFLAASYSEKFCELDIGQKAYVAVAEPIRHVSTGAPSSVCIDYPTGSLQPVQAKQLDLHSTPTPIPNP